MWGEAGRRRRQAPMLRGPSPCESGFGRRKRGDLACLVGADVADRTVTETVTKAVRGLAVVSPSQALVRCVLYDNPGRTAPGRLRPRHRAAPQPARVEQLIGNGARSPTQRSDCGARVLAACHGRGIRLPAGLCSCVREPVRGRTGRLRPAEGSGWPSAEPAVLWQSGAPAP